MMYHCRATSRSAAFSQPVSCYASTIALIGNEKIKDIDPSNLVGFNLSALVAVFLIHSCPTLASTSTSRVLISLHVAFTSVLACILYVPCPLDLHGKFFTENLSPFIYRCLHHLHIQLCPLNLNVEFLMEALGPLVKRWQHTSIHLLMVFSNSDQWCLPQPPSFLGCMAPFISALIISWLALSLAWWPTDISGCTPWLAVMSVPHVIHNQIQ